MPIVKRLAKLCDSLGTVADVIEEENSYFRSELQSYQNSTATHTGKQFNPVVAIQDSNFTPEVSSRKQEIFQMSAIR